MYGIRYIYLQLVDVHGLNIINYYNENQQMLVNIPYMDPMGGISSTFARMFFPTYEDTWLLFLDKKQRSEEKKNAVWRTEDSTKHR